ncbi:hypothetical protein ALC53_06363 [Atta colombica]|uniref:Uncharacterized protein n=1 Tax=Atta colombica TaxID=520822 RepID=A0A195BFY9_9HYME|nr:hypothetical protein ALC53_06363 [Atta colombica]
MDGCGADRFPRRALPLSLSSSRSAIPRPPARDRARETGPQRSGPQRYLNATAALAARVARLYAPSASKRTIAL